MDDWFDSPIWLFTIQVAILSFAAVGGGLAMLMPELQRFMVIEHQWLTNEEFIAAFTIGQAAPGDILQVYDGEELVAIAVAGDDGAWEAELPGGLLQGEHALTVVAVAEDGTASQRVPVGFAMELPPTATLTWTPSPTPAATHTPTPTATLTATATPRSPSVAAAVTAIAASGPTATRRTSKLPARVADDQA